MLIVLYIWTKTIFLKRSKQNLIFSEILTKIDFFKVISKKLALPRNDDILGDMGKKLFSKVINVIFLEMLISSEIWAKNDSQSDFKTTSLKC